MTTVRAGVLTWQGKFQTIGGRNWFKLLSLPLFYRYFGLILITDINFIYCQLYLIDPECHKKSMWALFYHHSCFVFWSGLFFSSIQLLLSQTREYFTLLIWVSSLYVLNIKNDLSFIRCGDFDQFLCCLWLFSAFSLIFFFSVSSECNPLNLWLRYVDVTLFLWSFGHCCSIFFFTLSFLVWLNVISAATWEKFKLVIIITYKVETFFLLQMKCYRY